MGSPVHGELEDHLVADGQARADRQGGDVEARDREVLAGRARSDRVALRRDALDRLDPQDRDGPVRPAVHRVVSRCASPSTPKRVTRAASTGSFGTPPGETLTWSSRPSAHAMHPLTVRRPAARPIGTGAGYHGQPRSHQPASGERNPI